MAYDRELFVKKLERWKKYMMDYRLPTWEMLPDMELYMDQVVTLVTRYLDFIPHDEQNPIVTASTINNYVRLKFMPSPVKKRYSRRHLAYAILICTLKQSLSLTEIQKILPPDLDDAQTAQLYGDFAARMSDTAQGFIRQVQAEAGRCIVPENDQGCTSLILHSAVSSVLYKVLTVKFTGLQDEKAED